MLFQYMTLAGLTFGAFAGFVALFRPAAIANMLRLQPVPDKPGGFAEFRATFGGVFFMIHMTAFVCVQHLPPLLGTFVVLPVAMGWFGAALARLVSMALDKPQNGDGGINRYWVMLEIFVGALILSTAIQITTGA